MARARSKARKPARNSSGFGAFVLGAVVGVVVTALYMGVIQDRPPTIGRGIDNVGKLFKSSSEDGEQQTEAVSGSSEKGASDGFDYKFYDILLDEEYVLPSVPGGATAAEKSREPEPATQTAAQPPAKQAEPEPAAPGDGYVLQAGSYRSFEDADELKARLALSGISSYIQKVTIEGRGDFYRVRLGPFTDVSRMKSTNDALKSMNIQAISFKVKLSG